MLLMLRDKNKALTGFEPVISCLLDRRFNQLSHGAEVSESFLQTHPMKPETWKNFAQRGARTHDPEIKSLMLYRLS